MGKGKEVYGVPSEGDAAGVSGVETLGSAVAFRGAGEDKGGKGIGNREGGFHGGEGCWCGKTS